MQRFLTSEVAKMLGLSTGRLYQLINVDVVTPPATRYGAGLLWSPADVERAKQEMADYRARHPRGRPRKQRKQ